jgi:hypothetical protein
LEDARLVRLYWKAWEIAWNRLRQPTPLNGFVSAYIDPGGFYNIHWDQNFIVLYSRYGFRIFPASRELSNFYVKQHPDGMICKEHWSESGEPVFYGDPISPVLYSFTEWESYCLTGDRERLSQILPNLLAYHEWVERNRKGKDGLYFFLDSFSSADDQVWRDECTAWVDLTASMALDALYISKIAGELGDFKKKNLYLAKHRMISDRMNQLMWDPTLSQYRDLHERDEPLRSVHLFWPILAEVASHEQVSAMVEKHLTNPMAFWTRNPIPSVARDSCHYNFPDGQYWRGSVWPPTNYMVIQGLRKYGYVGLARTITLEYLRANTVLLEKKGSIFENISSERDTSVASSDFVGWSGLGPISCLIEDVLGIDVKAHLKTITWMPTLLSRNGIKRLAMGEATISLEVTSRQDLGENTTFSVTTDKAFRLRLFTGKISGKLVATDGQQIDIGKDGWVTINVPSGERKYLTTGLALHYPIIPAVDDVHTSLAQDSNLLELHWRPSTSPYVIGYHVYIMRDGELKRLTDAPLLYTGFPVPREEDNNASNYLVRAVGMDGVESEVSDSVCRFKPWMTLPPEHPIPWFVIGPFRGAKTSYQFPYRYPPEWGVDLKARYPSRGGKWIAWKKWTSQTRYVDMAEAICQPLRRTGSQDHAVAFALTYVHSPKQREAYLAMGVDGGLRVWINGINYWNWTNPEKSVKCLEQFIHVTLQEGWNPMLVMVGRNEAPWGFYVSFFDLEGVACTDLKFGLEPKVTN